MRSCEELEEGQGEPSDCFSSVDSMTSLLDYSKIQNKSLADWQLRK